MAGANNTDGGGGGGDAVEPPACVSSCSEDQMNSAMSNCTMLNGMLADDGCSGGYCTAAELVEFKAFVEGGPNPDIARCAALDTVIQTPASGANAASLAVTAALCALAGASALLLA